MQAHQRLPPRTEAERKPDVYTELSPRRPFTYKQHADLATCPALAPLHWHEQLQAAPSLTAPASAPSSRAAAQADIQQPGVGVQARQIWRHLLPRPRLQEGLWPPRRAGVHPRRRPARPQEGSRSCFWSREYHSEHGVVASG